MCMLLNIYFVNFLTGTKNKVELLATLETLAFVCHITCTVLVLNLALRVLNTKF